MEVTFVDATTETRVLPTTVTTTAPSAAAVVSTRNRARCEECGKSFAQASYLRAHQAAVHSGELWSEGAAAGLPAPRIFGVGRSRCSSSAPAPENQP